MLLSMFDDRYLLISSLNSTWCGSILGLRMYNGKMRDNSSQDASLYDSIPMGGLALDTTVEMVIKTENGLPYYRY
jgi:hypothetical protein